MSADDVMPDHERYAREQMEIEHRAGPQRDYDETDPRSQGTPGDGDAVNHPSHYTFGKYEVVDVLLDWNLRYPLGNVIKYVARAGKKGGPEKMLEDLKKAQFYLNYYIAQKEKEK